MAVRQPDILEAPTGLSHYGTFGLEAANDAQNVRVDATRGKANDQQNLSKMVMWVMWYRSVYNKSLKMSEDTIIPVYKLMADNLQLVLIKVLIRWNFEH